MYKYLFKLLTVICDFIFLNLAVVSVFWVRFRSGILTDSYNSARPLDDYAVPMLILWGYWFLLFLVSGLYRNWTKESRVDQIVVVFKTITIGIVILFLSTGFDQIIDFIKTRNWHTVLTATKAVTFFQYWLSLSVLAVLNRVLLDTFFKLLIKKGIGACRGLIVGANESGQELKKNLEAHPGLGHKIVGYVDDDGRKKGTVFDGLSVVGTYSDLPDLCARDKIESIIISKVSSSHNEIMKIIQYCASTQLTIHIEPDLMDVVKGHVKTQQLYGVPLLVLLPEHMPGWQVNVKRFMDITISILALTLGLPVWLLLMIIIKLDSRGPVIFRQERIGQRGKPFILNKFRTMVVDAEKQSGPVWAGEHDPRITRVGRFLRKTRLDEIPQFINVIKGEMSLVGPRPERQFFIDKLKEEIPIYARRMKMKPGITGWAQVKHHYDQNIDDVKKKTMYDLYYFENMSIGLDIKILLTSIWVVFTGKGAR